MSEPASAPDAIGEQLTGLNNGDWVRIDLDTGSTLEGVMVVDDPEREDPTESYGDHGGIWFSAETTNEDRDRLDLPSVLLYIRASETESEGWKRATVDVYGSGDGTDYKPVGEIESIEARSPPT